MNWGKGDMGRVGGGSECVFLVRVVSRESTDILAACPQAQTTS